MTLATPIRIMVVDDHTLFRRGLVALLAGDDRFTVVAEAQDAGEAYRRAAAKQPDVILLDNRLPGVSGVDAVPGLRQAAPQACVLMLTMSDDQRDLAAALRAGARGYLLKTVDSQALAQAIIDAMAGASVVSPEMTGKLVSAFQALHGEAAAASPVPPPVPPVHDPIDFLSPREQHILAQI
ncbi:MAG: response regulator transcription factor, partial [Burkholderiales bacterium]|nr:response regulator transcription factor [Burkholderiales bacterium]